MWTPTLGAKSWISNLNDSVENDIVYIQFWDSGRYPPAGPDSGRIMERITDTQLGDSESRIDAKGVWLNRGAEMLRQDIISLFYRHIRQDTRDDTSLKWSKTVTKWVLRIQLMWSGLFVVQSQRIERMNVSNCSYLTAALKIRMRKHFEAVIAISHIAKSKIDIWKRVFQEPPTICLQNACGMIHQAMLSSYR